MRRSVLLLLLLACPVWAEPHICLPAREQLAGGRLSFEFGSLAEPAGVCWTVEDDSSTSDALHYRGIKLNPSNIDASAVYDVLLTGPVPSNASQARALLLSQVSSAKPGTPTNVAYPLPGSLRLPYTVDGHEHVLLLGGTSNYSVALFGPPDLDAMARSYQGWDKPRSFTRPGASLSDSPLVMPGGELQLPEGKLAVPRDTVWFPSTEQRSGLYIGTRQGPAGLDMFVLHFQTGAAEGDFRTNAADFARWMGQPLDSVDFARNTFRCGGQTGYSAHSPTLQSFGLGPTVTANDLAGLTVHNAPETDHRFVYLAIGLLALIGATFWLRGRR
jgi:hypothetical protein